MVEEVMIVLKRARRGESVVDGMIFFQVSGRMRRIKAVNERRFWRAVDKELKGRGFRGIYKRGIVMNGEVGECKK